ncbi:MAG: hypothetical protein LBJ11_00265 [Oscillospiraceae bacterium]|jgi:phosphatidylglycerol lysyltransferase|nr:hypothetical protein [Oscillospiraceae bacterium]
MNLVRRNAIKQLVIGSTIFLLVVSALWTLLSHFFSHKMEEHHFLHHVIDVLRIFVLWQLASRSRNAWRLYVTIVAIDVVFYMYEFYLYQVASEFFGFQGLWELVINVYVLVVLLVFHGSFRRKAAKASVRLALIPLGVMGFVALFNYTRLGYDAAVDIIFGSGKTFVARMEGIVFWVGAVAALFLMLRPVVKDHIHSKSEKAYARRLVKKYGQNPTSYLVWRMISGCFSARTSRASLRMGSSAGSSSCWAIRSARKRILRSC